jgi:hypothetical protein
MRLRRRMTIGISSLLAGGVMVLAAVTAAPAGAVTKAAASNEAGAVKKAVASNEICGNYGNGYCLNAWSGGVSGSAVKMYYGGNNSHDDFIVTTVNACDGGDISTPTCPFANTALDNKYRGQPVVEYKYEGTNLCIATTSAGKAVLGTCDNPGTASGGADGVLFVEWYSANNCEPADATPQGLHYAINRYWSDADGTAETLQSGGNPGVQAYLNYGGFNTCWGVN